MRFCSFNYLLAVLILLGVQSATALDSVGTVEGTVRGKILSQSPTKIVVESKLGIEEQIPVNEVRSVRYDEEPDALAEARNKVRSRDFSAAGQLLRNVDLGSLDRAMVKQDVEYLRAYCAAQQALGGVGTAANAGRLMNNFLKRYPDSYRFYAANEVMGDLLVAAGKPEKAMAYYDKAEGPWPESQLRLALARARTLAAQGDHEQAIAEYQKVLDSGQQGPLVKRYRLTATLGKASELAEVGRGEEGIKEANKIIKSAERGDTEIHALAYNAIGNCYRTMNRPKEAVLQYLHTDTLYFQHPALHAESLGRMAELWEQMEKPERAARARKTLASRYPNSRWAQ
jgi:tetratricopeptide (TPR) repeat protein